MNDIIIVGAGPVGSLAAVLARQARPDLRIKILDRDSAPTESGKTVALTFSSRRILEDAGVWDSISNCVAPIIEARTTYQRCFGRGIIRAADADVDALGYAIPLSILHRAMRKFADDLLVAPATLQSIEKKGGGIELKIAKESGETESLLCRLLILAAEFSPPILPADFSAHSFAYKQAAISCEAHADNLRDGESHERFASGGVIAIVPRREESSDKNCALIWCAPTDSALRLSQMDDASFIAAVGEECGGATPLIVSVGPRRAHKLQMRIVRPIARGGILLIGQGAQTVHPIGAQGLNLGFRDAHEFSRILADSNVQNADEISRLCNCYRAARRRDRISVIAATHGFSGMVPLSSTPPRQIIALAATMMEMSCGIRGFFARRMIFGG